MVVRVAERDATLPLEQAVSREDIAKAQKLVLSKVCAGHTLRRGGC